MNRFQILGHIIKRRLEQQEKFPEEHDGLKWKESDDRKYVILGEEVGEIARAMLENDPENLFDELIDVAALCFAWMESDY